MPLKTSDDMIFLVVSHPGRIVLIFQRHTCVILLLRSKPREILLDFLLHFFFYSGVIYVEYCSVGASDLNTGIPSPAVE